MPQIPPAAPTETEISAAFEVNNSSALGTTVCDNYMWHTFCVNIFFFFCIADQVVALFPYTAQNEDELSFLQGDVLIIIDREDPAWWRGELKGRVLYTEIYMENFGIFIIFGLSQQTGLFPSNYVEVMGSLAASAALGAAASSASSNITSTSTSQCK